jgi:hypothetical protein
MGRIWRAIVWALDLVDAKGDPDFGKFMQAITQLALLALLWRSDEVPFPLALALIVSAHGSRVLLAALKSGVFGAKVDVQRQETVSHTITERRDAGLAIEPTP